jgi:hypothetical protein
MADDLKKRGSPDNRLINTKQDHELDYWTKRLGVTRAQLRAAVRAVGNSARAVRKHLGK